MKSATKWFALPLILLVLSSATALARQTKRGGGGFNVRYLEVPEEATSKDQDKGRGTLRFDSEHKQLEFASETKQLKIPYASITGFVLNDSSKAVPGSAAVGLGLGKVFIRKRAHYFTAHYTDSGGEEKSAMFQLSKEDSKKVVQAAKDETGKDVKLLK